MSECRAALTPPTWRQRASRATAYDPSGPAPPPQPAGNHRRKRPSHKQRPRPRHTTLNAASEQRTEHSQPHRQPSKRAQPSTHHMTRQVPPPTGHRPWPVVDNVVDRPLREDRRRLGGLHLHARPPHPRVAFPAGHLRCPHLPVHVLRPPGRRGPLGDADVEQVLPAAEQPRQQPRPPPRLRRQVTPRPVQPELPRRGPVRRPLAGVAVPGPAADTRPDGHGPHPTRGASST